MPQIEKALRGSQEQQEPHKMAVNTTARHYQGPAETCSCTVDMQNFQLTWSYASKLTRSDIFSLFLPVSPDGLEITSVPAARAHLLTNTQDSNFDAYIISIQVKSTAFCRKIFGHVVNKRKHHFGKFWALNS